MTDPTAGAIRAAKELQGWRSAVYKMPIKELATIIDRETSLPELLKAAKDIHFAINREVIAKHGRKDAVLIEYDNFLALLGLNTHLQTAIAFTEGEKS